MDWLKKIREEKNFTLSKVAEETGISLCYLSQIESGKRKASVKIAKKIASFLGFEWTLFFNEKSK